MKEFAAERARSREGEEPSCSLLEKVQGYLDFLDSTRDEKVPGSQKNLNLRPADFSSVPNRLPEGFWGFSGRRPKKRLYVTFDEGESDFAMCIKKIRYNWP